MIAEGTYKARGVEGALGYASNDSEQVAVSLVLLEGPDEGKHITWYGFFTEKTTEVTLKSLRTLGWQGDDLSDLTGIDQNEVYAVIAHEEDQEGNPRARVRWINAGGGLALKTRMDDGAAKAFAERMKGHVLAAKSRTPGSPAAASNQQSRAAANGQRGGGGSKAESKEKARDNDDIPF